MTTPTTDEVRNPIFARVFVRLRQRETPEQIEHRRELLAGLGGRVLDLGAGDGANFAHFPISVSEVVAVEPEPYLRAQAARNAGHAPVPVRVVDGVADHLPVADGSVDAAIVALILCSVPDQTTALAELRRVIRPGGELRFYEHVLAHDRRLARVQRFVDRTGLWPQLAGGCHSARDTLSAIEAAGFTVERCRRMSVKPCALAVPVAPHLLGIARAPDR